MKTKHAIYISLTGFILIMLGALLKILHLSGANAILFTAVSIQIIGVALLAFKLSTNPSLKDILNK